MKRILLALTLTVYIFSPSAAVRVFAAAPSYARASAAEAYFYNEKDDTTALFIVPYTYCIEILRDDGDWYYAAYASNSGIYKQVTGYCLKQDFTPVEGTPEVTFLYKSVTVTYRTEDVTGSLPVLGEISIEAAFYGNFISGGAAYSYVYSQGSFGYIKGATNDYPLNQSDEPLDKAADDTPSQSVNLGLITALVICALAAVALILLYFTSRKKNRTDA